MQKTLTSQQRANKKHNANLKSTRTRIWLNNEAHKLISEKAKECNTTIAYALTEAINKYVTY